MGLKQVLILLIVELSKKSILYRINKYELSNL